MGANEFGLLKGLAYNCHKALKYAIFLNKMKITLISTSTFPSDQGIITISSMLKKEGYIVNLIFMCLSEDYSKNYAERELIQLKELCRDSQLIVVNSYASTAHRAEKLIDYLKNTFPEIPIVYGGIYATVSPEKAIKDCDIICVGEGEGAILDIARAVESKKSLNKIQNLWIRKIDNYNKEGIIKNPVRKLIDSVDSIPFPDYEINTHYILENHKIRKFEEKDLGGGIFFLTGRGCPYGCDYCSNSLFNELYNGKRKSILRWHSPEYIINGILFLKNKFPSLSYFDIRDDTFSLRPLEDIKKFCKLYKQKVNMRFKCLGDPKTISDEKVALLVDAGCTDIIIGIQGCERTNKEIYHRGQDDNGVLRASDILTKYKNKLAVMYDIITCNPYETPEDIIKDRKSVV